ncbi:DUF3667 domain-containing protein [Chryseobacterium sp. A321]
MDTGIFYTIKALFIRPGESIRAYLKLNRKKLIKPILFLIVTSLLYSLVKHHTINYGELDGSTVAKILTWIQDHYGYSNLFMGLFIALFLKWFFRKPKYNFFEILVLLSYVMGFSMLIFGLAGLIHWIFGVELFITGGILAIIYTLYAITDFYGRKSKMNYFKVFMAYFLGVIVFYSLVVFVGLAVDNIKS